MKLRSLILIGAAGLFGVGDEDQPGWLSEALASTDPDVEAAIAAYDDGEGDLDEAGQRLDAAVARRGERAELYYDKGLIALARGDLDAARSAFEHGTESSEIQVRASSHYELGNLAMAGEDWDGAIAAYRECLIAQPDHQNAKWNLELALLRKAEQEKEEQENQDQENQDQDQDQDQENQDQQDQENQDQENQDQDQENQDQQDQENQDQENQDQQDQENQDQENQDQENQDQQDQPQPQPDEQEEQQAEPQPIEGADLDAALDELDRQDPFLFGRPRGSQRKVEKDW